MKIQRGRDPLALNLPSALADNVTVERLAHEVAHAGLEPLRVGMPQA